MRHVIFLLLVAIAVSCSPENKPEAVSIENEPPEKTISAEGEGIPAGAQQETFADTPDVVQVTFNEGGITQKGVYVNGKREGVWSEFQPNGLLKSVTSYVRGVKEGLYAEVNQSGQVTKRFFYHNNLRHGEYKEFNYTTLKEERTYQYGKLEGTVKIYYDNGKIMEEGQYRNGTRDGISKWYDQEGKPTITYEYKNGELVKK